MSDHQHAQLIAWLEDRGHTSDEIDRILAKVKEYDERTVHESVFDSIESGAFDLAKVIDEALSDDGPEATG
ncbi:MAG: hypothetical protein AAF266_16735 [Planctomycetota bacterium]